MQTNERSLQSGGEYIGGKVGPGEPVRTFFPREASSKLTSFASAMTLIILPRPSTLPQLRHHPRLPLSLLLVHSFARYVRA